MRGSRAAALAVVIAAFHVTCATKTAPPLPASPMYPDFVYPVMPRELDVTKEAASVVRGWRFLQNDDLRNAEREFSAALRRNAAFYPARAAEGYVALARSDAARALASFDAALQTAPRYVPALVGRGHALQALNRDRMALEAYELALRTEPSLPNIRNRIDALRFRAVEALIASARAAAAADRFDEAARAYRQALASAPDSGFLYRELGAMERRRGRIDAALDHFNKALTLDPADVAAWIATGELLEQNQNFDAAEAAYRHAAELDPSPEVSSRLAAAVGRAREARLPHQFGAIARSSQVTRGELAALIGVRLDDVLRDVPVRQVVMTDVARHWAESWIVSVARAGILDAFPNHTFQPGGRVSRADVASAVNRLIAHMAQDRPSLRVHLAARPRIADMREEHLSYPAVSVAVASGVMPLAGGGRFDASRPVSGSEAAEVVARLLALAASPR